MNAEEMFEKLGFEKCREDEYEVLYINKKWNEVIGFDKREKGFFGYISPHAHGAQPLYIGGDLLKVVLKMMKERGWYDDVDPRHADQQIRGAMGRSNHDRF